jgi:NAD(P) transhydrogenase
MSAASVYDILVIGSGPAGQKAAIQGAKAGKRVCLIEREQGIGGNCVHRGTIPSKTLREGALQLLRMARLGAAFQFRLQPETQLSSLLHRVDEVVRAHDAYMSDQLRRNGITYLHGRARLVSEHQVEMVSVDGITQQFSAEIFVLAAGSRPRAPREIPIDHEHILDSDSVLSMIYLPKSLTVLGGGVIACEYASMFALLGVEVTLIDKAERPLQFLDKEIVGHFVQQFERQGGRCIGKQAIRQVAWDGVQHVVTTTDDGRVVRSEKMLVALGRQPNVEDLNLAAAGIAVSPKGVIGVNEFCQTSVPHIYAVGDMTGPPALAATAMEQGRRAVSHALGLPLGNARDQVPVGIYTLPEMSAIGLDEDMARERYRSPFVGRARFNEVARGQIAGAAEGLLKMVADPEGRALLGVQIIGEGATELIHLAQLALQQGASVDLFVENIFNFPTYAEAYRVAALDILGQRCRRAISAVAA